MMDLLKIKKFDDNSLFRYFSKSYSKNQSSFFPNSISTFKSMPNQFNRTQNDQKIRSQSSSFCNNLSKSVTISQKNSLPRPGFLKYRKFSINESVPLNSSIQLSNKSHSKFSVDFKTLDERNLTDFKKTINEYSINRNTLQQFGLRNIVKEVKNQFRSSPDDNTLIIQRQKQVVQNDLLSFKSKRMFLGNKRYNLNGFVITQNVKGLKKGKKSVIKSSILRRKNKQISQAQMNVTSF